MNYFKYNAIPAHSEHPWGVWGYHTCFTQYPLQPYKCVPKTSGYTLGRSKKNKKTTMLFCFQANLWKSGDHCQLINDFVKRLKNVCVPVPVYAREL